MGHHLVGVFIQVQLMLSPKHQHHRSEEGCQVQCPSARYCVMAPKRLIPPESSRLLAFAGLIISSIGVSFQHIQQMKPVFVEPHHHEANCRHIQRNANVWPLRQCHHVQLYVRRSTRRTFSLCHSRNLTLRLMLGHRFQSLHPMQLELKLLHQDLVASPPRPKWQMGSASSKGCARA